MPTFTYDHFHLISPNPRATARFYETMFGAEMVGVKTLPDGRTNVELQLHGWRFMIASEQVPPLPGASSSAPGFGHICLRTNDVESAVRKLRENGVGLVGEIKSPRPGVKVAFLAGPDNVLIELSERNIQP